jgi:hypothetical protein
MMAYMTKNTVNTFLSFCMLFFGLDIENRFLFELYANLRNVPIIQQNSLMTR